MKLITIIFEDLANQDEVFHLALIRTLLLSSIRVCPGRDSGERG